MISLETDRVSELRAKVAGVVALAGEPGYADAVAIWNGAIDRRPSIVVRATSAQDVSAAILFARGTGLEISVRGGGHSFAGNALTDGGLMIDLTLMKAIKVDPASKRAIAEGGVNWGEIDAATQKFGLALPGGMITHTGIAGLTLGGGIGWLATVAGLSCDNLVGAEIVTADGLIRRVSDKEDPELLWALKGGGGNFGVVTKFEYSLTEVGPDLPFAEFFWRFEDGREALKFARDLIPTLPRSVAPFLASANAPPAPFIPEDLRGKPTWVLILVGFGDPAEHAQAVARARQAGAAVQRVETISYVQLQSMWDVTAPWGSFSYEKAVHLEDLTDEVIEVMLTHQPRKTARLSFTPILILGGAFREIPESSASFSGSRTAARYVLNITAVCETREQYDADREWVRNYWTALAPHAPNIGSYVNFMSEYDADRVRIAYGPEKFDRLVKIKRALDPQNVFHLNANIKP
jgi:FAD/FMN-containing dehydrogenase